MTKFKHLEKQHKNAINNGQTIAILWSIDDVHNRAENAGLKLTDAEAVEILAHVENSHDASHGITWEHIDYAMHDFIDNRG